MDQTRWNQIEALLQSALDLEPDQRAAFLSRVQRDDEDLFRELDSLLRAESGSIDLESPAIAHLAGRADVSLAGQQIGHYRVGRSIGAGGMGEIYEAFDERLQRTVALKALSSEFASDPERVRRFEQEAFAASRLNHPNIITIFETFHAGEAHFIATERIDGRTLRELITDKQAGAPRSLPVEQALDMVLQVAAALEAAHTAWIIHRDIKPENIMVRSDGLVKVLDFGIAKLRDEAIDEGERIPLDASPSHGDLTVPGAILGTASYMAPEQAAGESLDGRADLYSLGLVLHEMVTGRRLLQSAVPAGGSEASPVASGQQAASRRRVDHLPRELQRIIRTMVQTERDRRYASASDLIEDLARVKRRVESRSVRRWLGLGALALVISIGFAALAAVLSVQEAWEERLLGDGHTAAARQAVFSPDGRLVISCGEDGKVIVWDFAGRNRLATLTGQTVHKIALSPDGRWLATGGTDGTIILWDPRRAKKLEVLREHRAEIGALSFSQDGALLAASSRDGPTIVWNTVDWTKLGEWPFGASHGTFAFSSEGRLLLLPSLEVADLADGSIRASGIEESPNWMAMSKDAGRLATIDPWGNLALYRLAEPGDPTRVELIARHRAHHDHGRAVAFSPDGLLIASAAEDIQLWDGITGQRIARFDHPAVVWSVEFSHDGRWLVSAHGDGAVLIWDVAERRLAANFNQHGGAVRAVAFDAAGDRVASAGDDRTITLWDAGTGRKRSVLSGHRTRVTAISFFNDQRRLGSVDQDAQLFVWDLARHSPRKVFRPRGSYSQYYALAISPDDRLVAAGNDLFSSTGGMIARIQTRGAVYGAAFSQDGKWLALVTDGGSLFLWDTQRRRLAGSLQVSKLPQISVSFAPDGRSLVTGGDGGVVRLFSTSPLREVAILGRHTARVKSVAFSPDGETVASAGDDRTIRLWGVESREPSGLIGTHASPVYSIAFSPDGRRLVSGEHDHSVRLYTRQRSVWGFVLD